MGYADSEVKYGFSNDSAILTVDGVNVSYLENEYYKAYADKFGSHFVKLAEKTDGAKISPEFRDKISKWETGQGYPDMNFLPKLASVFSVSIDFLLGDNNA